MSGVGRQSQAIEMATCQSERAERCENRGGGAWGTAQTE